MNPYIVCPSPSTEYSAVVMATSYARPSEALDEVANDLRQRNVTGKVLFDLLAANGTRTRRFFVTEFNGKEFGPFQMVEVDSQVRQASARFFVEHEDKVDLSLLSAAMRVMVRRGQEV